MASSIHAVVWGTFANRAINKQPVDLLCWRRRAKGGGNQPINGHNTMEKSEMPACWFIMERSAASMRKCWHSNDSCRGLPSKNQQLHKSLYLLYYFLSHHVDTGPQTLLYIKSNCGLDTILIGLSLRWINPSLSLVRN